jgi:hypothetical protein
MKKHVFCAFLGLLAIGLVIYFAAHVHASRAQHSQGQAQRLTNELNALIAGLEATLGEIAQQKG